MKQKMLVTSVIVVAAIACIAIIVYLGEYSNRKAILAEKVKVESELKKVKESFAKTQAELHKSEKEIAELKAQIANMQKAKVEEEAKAKELQELLTIATAQRKEGVQHTIIRQERKNKKLPEAQKEAQRLSIRGGYVDPKTGREIRIKGKGGDAAFPLEKDEKGKVTAIKEYKKDKDGKFKPVIERKLASDFKSSEFIGDIKGKDGLQPYEYIHKKK